MRISTPERPNTHLLGAVPEGCMFEFADTPGEFYVRSSDPIVDNNVVAMNLRTGEIERDFDDGCEVMIYECAVIHPGSATDIR